MSVDERGIIDALAELLENAVHASTAGGVVFSGDNEGNFMAFDSRTGKNLWRYQTGTPIWGAGPMTYMLDGRQHVVVASGTTLVSFALPADAVSSPGR